MVLQITLVGLGTVGTSMGLALKSTAAALTIVGHDKDSTAAKRAHALKAVDRTDWNLIGACEKADLVVLSLPLAAIRPTLEALAPVLRDGCVVTDTAELKVPVLRWAHELLPAHVPFVGGHPILQESGDDPSADALSGATYCLTPDPATVDSALQTVSNLAEATGAKVRYLDAVEHDSLMAAVEQLPQMAALALQRILARAPAKAELAELAGAPYHSLSQLLDKGAAREALPYALNAAHLARCVRELAGELLALGDLIEQDGKVWEQTVQSAMEATLEKEDRAEQPRTDRGILGQIFPR